MVLFRALGWLLLVCAIAAAVHNGLIWWSERAFRLLTLGELWGRLDYGSLSGVQGFFTDRISARGWTWGVAPVLALPAAPVFLVLGLLGLWLGQAGGEGGRRSAPSTFVGGGRRSRRRRSRGLS